MQLWLRQRSKQQPCLGQQASSSIKPKKSTISFINVKITFGLVVIQCIIDVVIISGVDNRHHVYAYFCPVPNVCGIKYPCGFAWALSASKGLRWRTCCVLCVRGVRRRSSPRAAPLRARLLLCFVYFKGEIFLNFTFLDYSRLVKLNSGCTFIYNFGVIHLVMLIFHRYFVLSLCLARY